MLTGGPSDFPKRQQTLRGLIDWSHNLLERREQRLLACMGVFVFTLSRPRAFARAVLIQSRHTVGPAEWTATDPRSRTPKPCVADPESDLHLMQR